MQNYKRLEKIGEGTYATVYRGIHMPTHTQVALKQISVSPHEGTPSTALREIAFMKELLHANIVRLLEVIHGDDGSLVLVFECLQCDLRMFMDDNCCVGVVEGGGGLDLRTVRSLLWQLVSGIAHCHRHQILHRDLKPQNLLISQPRNHPSAYDQFTPPILKLADFGLARTYGIPVDAYSNEVVTLWYRAPDILLGSQSYGPSIDIWSIGCIFAELLLGRPLFPGKSREDQLMRIFQILGTPTPLQWTQMMLGDTFTSSTIPKQFPHRSNPQPPPWTRSLPYHPPQRLENLFQMLNGDGISLLQSMLAYNPGERQSAENILAHSFFKTPVKRPVDHNKSKIK